MSEKDKAYQPFRVIEKRFEEVAESLGLTVERICFFPDKDCIVQVIWALRPEAVLSEAEKDQLRVDQQFAGLTMGFDEDDPMEKRIADAKEKMLQFLKDHKPEEK